MVLGPNVPGEDVYGAHGRCQCESDFDNDPDGKCVRFHPNSLYLATGSYDKSVRMWDVQRGACIRLLTGHTDSVTTLAISPDGRTLASAGE